MKSFYNRLNIILTIFFVLGILFSAYNLFNLPVQLEQQSGNIDLNVVKEIKPVLNQTYVIVGFTLLLGLISTIIYLFMQNYSKAVEKIVYVEKTASQKKADEVRETQKEEQQHRTLLDEIKKDLNTVKEPQKKYEKVLSNLCMKLEASQGIVYQAVTSEEKRFLEYFASFAFSIPDSKSIRYEFGEGLAGQVAKEGKSVNITDVPEGYITIISGLGKSTPKHLVIVPVHENDQVTKVIEIASFKPFTQDQEKLIEDSFKLIDHTEENVKSEALDVSDKEEKKKGKKK